MFTGLVTDLGTIERLTPGPVTDVWVAGERVVRGRTPVRLDVASLAARARLWQQKLQ